jgi:non-homologous end joining protein Ku
MAPRPCSCRNDSAARSFIHIRSTPRSWPRLRKLIAFDDDTLDKLTQLARDRMATFQELADEAFADLLKKHGIPIDLKDALRKSAGLSKDATPKKTRSRTARAPS